MRLAPDLLGPICWSHFASGLWKPAMNQENATPEARYERPQLTQIGSFEAVTQGHSAGSKTDAAFPVGTPRGSITFS